MTLAKNETEAAWDSAEYNAERARKYEKVLRSAFSWWLSSGKTQSHGSPAWVFAARELLDSDDSA